MIEGAQRTIHLREIDALETLRLPDTDGADKLDFSPDGQSITFFAHNKLRRFDLGDRRAIDLCDARKGSGISWGSDGTIVFTAGWINPLSRVSAEGGTPEPATLSLPKTPSVLIFTNIGGATANEIRAAGPNCREQTVQLPATGREERRSTH